MPQSKYNLHLKGIVGGADFDRNYVDYVLSKNDGKDVSVLIDSLGGSLASALSIAAAFRNHGSVSVHFVGMNASAATIASLGAAHISMDRNAMYLVHKCSSEFFEWGSLNADQFRSVIADCQKAVADLDKLDLNVAQMYAAKCSKPTDDLLDLMRSGGWLSAKEALEWGFVDEVTELDGEEAPKLSEATASAMVAAGMPLPDVAVESASHGDDMFQRFFDRLAAMFSSKAKPKPNPPMNKVFKSICALLQVESIAITDGNASLSDVQLAAIEAELAAKSAAIAELKSAFESLKSAPADSTTAVVDDQAKPSAEPRSAIEQYCDAYNSAKALFNALK